MEGDGAIKSQSTSAGKIYSLTCLLSEKFQKTTILTGEPTDQIHGPMEAIFQQIYKRHEVVSLLPFVLFKMQVPY